MTKFVLDSWAWVEYLNASQKGNFVRDLIEKPENEIYSSSISLAEVISKAIRQNRDKSVPLTAIRTLSKIVNVDDELANEAGIIHADFKSRIQDFGLADAFIIATAKKLGAKIITGDPHFKHVKGAILL